MENSSHHVTFRAPLTSPTVGAGNAGPDGSRKAPEGPPARGCPIWGADAASGMTDVRPLRNRTGPEAGRGRGQRRKAIHNKPFGPMEGSRRRVARLLLQ